MMSYLIILDAIVFSTKASKDKNNCHYSNEEQLLQEIIIRRKNN